MHPPSPETEPRPETDARAHWDEIYRSRRATSSGQPSRILARIAATLPPGRALDLGSSNGDDVIWLAAHGWQALGLDISPVACDRAAARTATLELSGSARFFACDLALGLPNNLPQDLPDDLPQRQFDLVTALYFQSQLPLPRARILAEAARRVAPGGHFLLVSHAQPPGAAGEKAAAKGQTFPTLAEERAAIAADPQGWITREARQQDRMGKDPEGAPMQLRDNLLWLERRRG